MPLVVVSINTKQRLPIIPIYIFRDPSPLSITEKQETSRSFLTKFGTLFACVPHPSVNPACLRSCGVLVCSVLWDDAVTHVPLVLDSNRGIVQKVSLFAVGMVFGVCLSSPVQSNFRLYR